MNIPQLTALCLRYQGVLLDASEEVVHVAVVDAPSHELLDALHFATTKRIEITCWTRQQMEGHASRTQQTLPVSHHHFSDGNHGGCGNAAFCSAGVCRYL